MPQTFPSSQAVLSDWFDANGGPVNDPNLDDECSSVFEQLRTALAHCLELPGASDRWAQFRSARLGASTVIARFPRKERDTPSLHAAHGLVREMSKSGVHARVAAAEDLALAQVFARKGWPGVLAAMLLVPAWQWPAAPLLMEVPDWLRADYVRWLFAAPRHFVETGQAEAYAVFVLQRLEELVRWMNRGPGGAEEAKVLAAYASHSSLLPACLGTDDLRRQAVLRGQLLLRAMGQKDDHYLAPLKPRANRRLRIGVVHRRFDSQPEIFATLPLFVKLNPECFEVILFTYVSDFGGVEDFCRRNSSGLCVLPAELNSQLAMLRDAELDVAVFSTDLTAECNVVTRLALHRVAPLQVANNSSGVTTGLPEIDLYMTGALATSAGAAAQFNERLGLLPGPSHAFSFEADYGETQMACTRVDFGLPEDALVFVSTADFRKIIPEMQHSWARLLAAVPGSHLLVHPFHPNQASSHEIARFHAEFEAVLRHEEVDPARLAVSCVHFPTDTDVEGLIGLGDVYLDTFPFSAVQAMVDPLELGLPVVACEGDALRSRTGASLLRSLDMGELIANTVADYQAIAVKLATDAPYRESCGRRISELMKRVPDFIDVQATSRAFGVLMESAYDELVAKGRTSFRANPRPLGIE